MHVVRELGRIAKNLRHQENCGGQPRICGIMCRYVARELGRTAKKCAHHSLPALVHIHIAETVGRTAKNVPGIILFAESYSIQPRMTGRGMPLRTWKLISGGIYA